MGTFPSNIERTFQVFPTFTHWSHCEKDAHELTMYSTCNHQFPGPLTPSVKPYLFYLSEHMDGFVTDSLNQLMDNLAIQLEAYVMSGLKGKVVRQSNPAI